MIPSLTLWLRWESDLFSSYQWWRLFSGNFTHTNLYHLGMNLAGLILISYVFTPRVRQLQLHTGLLALCVGAGLLLTSTHIYYGLSGVLHGLFALYALQEVMQGKKSSLLLLMGLGIKLALEQQGDFTLSSAQWIGARVSTESHLIGAIAGLAMALIMPKIYSRR